MIPYANNSQKKLEVQKIRQNIIFLSVTFDCHFSQMLLLKWIRKHMSKQTILIIPVDTYDTLCIVCFDMYRNAGYFLYRAKRHMSK